MFLENASQKGWIEVICGSMFSGKTEELIRRLKRAEFARLRVEIFKPRIDVRYSEEEVVSHDASAIRSTPVDSAQNILLMTSDVDVVGIDEAQSNNLFVAGKAASFGLVKKEDASLAQYVTGKTLDGLFTMIGEEEKKIRQDPVGTGSAILQKVFGATR